MEWKYLVIDEDGDPRGTNSDAEIDSLMNPEDAFAGTVLKVEVVDGVAQIRHIVVNEEESDDDSLAFDELEILAL